MPRNLPNPDFLKFACRVSYREGLLFLASEYNIRAAGILKILMRVTMAWDPSPSPGLHSVREGLGVRGILTDSLLPLKRPLHGSRLPPSETKGQHFFRIGTVVLHRTAKLGTPPVLPGDLSWHTARDSWHPRRHIASRLQTPSPRLPPVLLTSNRSACLSESMYPVLTT